MLEPTYRQALSHAWKLTWHHKMVWIVGLLSVFLGQMGLSNFFGQLFAKFLTDEKWWPSSWGVMRIVTGEQLFWFSWTVLLVFGLLMFFLVAAVCAQGALLTMAIHWYHYHTVPSVTTAWRHGVKHFWGILAINFLEKLSLSAVLAAVLMSLNLFSSSTAGFFGQIVVVAAGLFLALVISATSIYALGYTVIDSVPVVEAVGRGYALFRRHLMVSLELSAVLILCNALVFAVISFIGILALLPSFLLMLFAGFTGYVKLLTVSMVLYLFLMVFMSMLVGAAFNVFTVSAWMYLFLKMHKEGLASRVLHWFSQARK